MRTLSKSVHISQSAGKFNSEPPDEATSNRGEHNYHRVYPRITEERIFQKTPELDLVNHEKKHTLYERGFQG